MRCATSRTVPGSIPGGITGFFSYIFPSDRTMVLESTQPLVKMSTRNIPGGKGGRCVRLKTSPSSCAECHEIWEPERPVTLWAIPGLLRDSFTFTSRMRLHFSSCLIRFPDQNFVSVSQCFCARHIPRSSKSHMITLIIVTVAKVTN